MRNCTQAWAIVIAVIAAAIAGCAVSTARPSPPVSDDVTFRECRSLAQHALPGMHGCAALDVAQSPHLFLAPSQTQLVAMRTELRTQGDPRLAALAPALDSAHSLVARATLELPQGNVCGSAQSLSEATHAIDRARSGLDSYESDLARSQADRLRPNADPAEIETRSVAITSWQSKLSSLRTEIGVVQSATAATCRTARAETVRSIVLNIDGARRRITLADGSVLGLRAQGYGRALYEKASVAAEITRFADGTGFLNRVTYDRPPPLPPPPPPEEPCFDLRILPVQPMGFEGELYGRTGLPVEVGAPYSLHRLQGYVDTSVGLHVFEGGMRLAVVEKECPEDKPVRRVQPHYRQGVEIKVVNLSGGQSDFWLGDFLKAGDLASTMDSAVGNIATLQVRYLAQYCAPVISATPDWSKYCNDTVCTVPPPDFDKLLQNGNTGCDAPVPIRTENYPFLMLEKGTFCEVDYASTEFDLEDHDLKSYRTAKISAANLIVLPGTPYHFWATGFAPSTPIDVGNGQVKASAIPVLDNQPFAIFSWEPSTSEVGAGKSGLPFPDSSDWAWHLAGTSNASGLRWPRVVGHNNGGDYAFSCRTPKLVRDVLHFCSPVRGFYRFPFEGWTWTVGQGSCACPINGSCTHRCGDTQEFAVDLPAPVNTPILAARGGKVIGLKNDVSFNCWEAECSGQHSGNFVQIEHQDGSVGRYAHMPQGGPSVWEGQRIRRGDVIGRSGNTGNSSGPHLHIHQQLSATNGQTAPMRFEVNNFAGTQYIKYDCRALQEDDDGLISTNHTH
jgi:murein DD-endopeptidase MepM/ murein hydrolase activator NlpD